jgi:hypothetical protein
LDNLEVSRPDFEKQIGNPRGPGLGLLRKVADSFEITVDDIVCGKLDAEWIRNPQLANDFVAGDGSRFRTSLPVLQWLGKEYGQSLSKNLLRSLKVPEHFMRQPNQPVKLRLLCSLLRAAAARGVPEQAFFEMGVDAFEIPENELVRRKLAAMRNPQEIYEWFFGEAIVQFETNYDYRIRKSRPDSVILELKPKEGRIQENGANVTSDRLLSIYRWGIAAGLIRWIGRSVASVSPIHFAGSDSSSEMFELTWNTGQAAFRDGEGWASKSLSPSLKLV